MWQRSRTRTRCRCQCHVYLLFEYRHVIGGRGTVLRAENRMLYLKRMYSTLLYSTRLPVALCTVQELLRWLFRNHSFISFLLYLAGLMAFVSSLVKKYYLRQFLLVCSDPLIAASMPAGLRSPESPALEFCPLPSPPIPCPLPASLHHCTPSIPIPSVCSAHASCCALRAVLRFTLTLTLRFNRRLCSLFDPAAASRGLSHLISSHLILS